MIDKEVQLFLTEQHFLSMSGVKVEREGQKTSLKRNQAARVKHTRQGSSNATLYRVCAEPKRATVLLAGKQ